MNRYFTIFLFLSDLIDIIGTKIMASNIPKKKRNCIKWEVQL